MLSDIALKNYALHPLKTFSSKLTPFNSNNTLKLEVNNLAALKTLSFSKEVSYLNATYVGPNIRGEKGEFYSTLETLLDKNPNLTNIILSDKTEQVCLLQGKYMKGLNAPYKFFYDFKNETVEMSIDSYPTQTLSLVKDSLMAEAISEFKATTLNITEIIKTKAVEVELNIKEEAEKAFHKEAASNKAEKAQDITAEIRELISKAPTVTKASAVITAPTVTEAPAVIVAGDSTDSIEQIMMFSY